MLWQNIGELEAPKFSSTDVRRKMQTHFWNGFASGAVVALASLGVVLFVRLLAART
jgi:hypothetical protein